MERPETQFAWTGTSALAYQVLGQGTPDLLFAAGFVSNVELNWEHPIVARFFHGLARSRRLIMVDPRGVGCSERASPNDVWPLETIMDDMVVVLDEVGSERAAILATGYAGFVAVMFAATYPERTVGIILTLADANYLWSEETPWEYTEEQWDEYVQSLRTWSRADAAEHVRSHNPSMAEDRDYVEWWYRYVLLSESLGAGMAATRKYMDTDVRAILPSIQVPTLIFARPDADESDAQAARYLADRIPGARLESLPGRDVAPWLGDQRSLHQAIDTFLADAASEYSELDRVVATVLFTDIVGSTQKVADLGDRAWRELVERHHRQVRSLINRYRGVEIDTAGDGFFASFDGPARAIRCARAIVDDVRTLGIEVRAGLHTGECETIDNKLGGVAVNIGARVGGLARPSEVLVSQTVRDLVAGSGLAFEDRGAHELKGIPDQWHLFAVTS